jgi:putative phosphoesterase
MPAAAPYDQARPAPLVVGVLSDTHGQLYPQVAKLLEGVDYIVHAGDVGSPEVLRALRLVAPVVAVRGNVDVGGWADALPSRAEIDLGGVCVVVGHIAPRPDGAGRRGQPVVVVSGHSHIAVMEQRGIVLYLNPGSAGPRRFGRSRTVARLEIWPPREGAAGEPAGAPRVTAEIIKVEGD